MAIVKITLNSAGVEALLKGPEITGDLVRRANAIAARAGDGIVVDVVPGPRRARVTVTTQTEEAKHEEATNRSLTNAIDAGR